jgi:transcriptional regulator with XRE-family HTH domain
LSGSSGRCSIKFTLRILNQHIYTQSNYNDERYLRENGYTPSVDMAVRIAKALGVSVEYLATGTEIQKKDLHSSLRPEIRSLIQSIAHLTEADRKIVLNNALYLAETLKKRK